MEKTTDYTALEPAALPETEPERQYSFIRKARELVKKKSEEAGRPLTACSVCMGCQMNARDSEKIEGVLSAVGYEKTDSEDADLVIFNTCTVRENANQKVYGHLGQLGGKKRRKSGRIIALCGCMMQEPYVVEKLRTSYPQVNLIFGTHNLYRFPEYLWRCLSGESPVIDIWEKPDRIVENLPTDRKYAFKSGVNIMFGCDNFCSYCIVPYVRGRERSREPEEILSEIRRLAKDGVVEVMLLGQNVNSYGKNLKESVTFAQLLRRVAEIEGVQRIRFMTSHPKDLSDELISVMAKGGKICPHLHLPLQSGSSRILSRMNRRYTKEQYLDLTERLRAAVPGISLTTDIIVGFPGETEEDFQETLDVVRRVRFDSAFTFQYSRRTGTPAASMPDQVPPDVVRERFGRLLAEVQQIAREVCGRDLHTVQEVLAESVSEQDPSLLTGRMGNNLLVHFPGDASQIGKLLPVYLTESRGFYYMGIPSRAEER